MKKIIIALFLMLIPLALYAQSADRITEILETEKINYGQLSYLAATMLDLSSDDVSDEEAIQALQKEGYATNIEASSNVTIAQTALLCAKAFNIKGSLWYMLLKNERYAIRMLKSYGIISQAIDPQSFVKGTDVLNLFTACIEFNGSKK